MSILPKIKKCPSCATHNIFRINGAKYQNQFKSLKEWELKKIFNCRSCNAELGLFFNSYNQEEKLIWTEYFKCEDSFHNELVKLQEAKNKQVERKKFNNKYDKIIEEIESIQNKIRQNQIKIKIKHKIKNKGMLIRHVY